MSARGPAVLVIGDVMLDVIAAPERAIAEGTDTPSTISLVPGGSGANQAAWLGHFGNRVRFAGRVGPDGAHDHAAALRAFGVEPRFARDASVRTGLLVTLVGAGGERSFLTDRGANARLARTDLPDALLDDVALVHVSGYAFSDPGPRAAVLDFLRVAAARNVACSVDAGSSAIVREAGAPAFFAWTRTAAICFMNAAEATVLAQSADANEQLDALGARYETLIVTGGISGVRATTRFGAERHHVAAERVVPVDTSGAGDAFLAAFLFARLRGERIATCLERGARAGTSAVLHYGGRPLQPSPATEIAIPNDRTGDYERAGTNAS